jgi:excisionase family DNA binding protein
MMSSAMAIYEPTAPSSEDSSLAKESSRQLSGLDTKNLRVHVHEVEEDIILPAAAVKLLIELLAQMAEGNAVTLMPIHAELTTQQAADILGVSRPHIVKLLERGKLPFRKVGTHRRILYEDLRRYKKSVDKQRLSVLEELTAQAQDLGMGY